MTTQLKYDIAREKDGTPRVAVFNATGQFYLLTPTLSQTLCNHSPDGFEWGYAGSGPSQLALAILLNQCLAICGDEKEAAAIALQHYQEFKWNVIAKLPECGGILTEEEILRFLATQTEDRT